MLRYLISRAVPRTMPHVMPHFMPHVMPWALAWMLLISMLGPADAGSFTRGCAARDWQLLLMIEERESSNTISAEQSGEALLTMMHARVVCHEGHVLDALAIYDGVAESIKAATGAALSGYGMAPHERPMPRSRRKAYW